MPEHNQQPVAAGYAVEEVRVVELVLASRGAAHYAHAHVLHARAPHHDEHLHGVQQLGQVRGRRHIRVV